jgi:hypothetical protein
VGEIDDPLAEFPSEETSGLYIDRGSGADATPLRPARLIRSSPLKLAFARGEAPRDRRATPQLSDPNESAFNSDQWEIVFDDRSRVRFRHVARLFRRLSVIVAALLRVQRTDRVA